MQDITNKSNGLTIYIRGITILFDPVTTENFEVKTQNIKVILKAICQTEIL